MFRCSLQVGALIGTDNKDIIDGLGKFGHAMGMTFQIHDDYLGIWGDEGITGKPAASDIAMRKKTLPIIFAIQKTTGTNREQLLQIYGKEKVDHFDVEKVLHVLNEIDTKSYVQEMSNKSYNQALSELETLDISLETKSQLEMIMSFLISREY